MVADITSNRTPLNINGQQVLWLNTANLTITEEDGTIISSRCYSRGQSFSFSFEQLFIQGRIMNWGFSGHCFRMFDINIFVCFVVAKSDLIDDIETTHGLCQLLTVSGNLF